MTVTTHLTTLEASGLVRLAQTQPELEYLFRHALLQDAAYGSLVRSDRRALHLAVAEAMERLYRAEAVSSELPLRPTNAPVLAY